MFPVVVVAMAPERFEAFFAPDDVARLRGLGEVRLVPPPTRPIDGEPLGRDDHVRMDSYQQALTQATVIVTGWETPLIDADQVASCRDLRGVVHTGGSIRGHVAAESILAGLPVSSQTAGNAIAVTEFTLAQILLGAKQVGQATRAYRARRGPIDPLTEFPLVGAEGSTVG
ncbi:MAG: hypothetical protein LBV00_08750, partial [Propionibacteriaceae bacterium]|nr:hypothetical protein [Propionibacteriaceae bacterium]